MSQYRLSNSADFDKILRRASIKQTVPGFLLLANPNNLGYARFGMIVGKKKVAKAVKRNQIKRRIKESFRLKFNSLPSCDIIVLVGRGCDKDNNKLIWGRLNQLWEKLLEK